MNTIWIGTDRGLNTMSDDLQKVNQPLEQEMEIRTLFSDGKGDLLIGTANGLRKWNDTTLENSFSLNALQPDILSIMVDKEGFIWTGTNGQGLFISRGENHLQITAEDGLPDNFIFSLARDSSGTIWMSSYDGVFNIERDSLLYHLERTTSRPVFTRFDENEGMPSRQCWGFGNPSVFLSSERELYYPTLEGLCLFQTGEHAVHEDPPVVLEDVTADGISFLSQIENGHALKNNTLEFHYTGFDYTAPEKLQFWVELQGTAGSERTFPLIRRRTLQVTDLDPGDYVFRLRAVNNAGQISRDPVVLPFRISRPFYNSSLFLTVLFLTLSLIALVIRVGRKKRADRARANKYKSMTLPQDLSERVSAGLKHLMEEEKLFLNPDLTLADLAKRLRVHSNYLSRIINETFGMNYNDFLNRYRIAEAKGRLCDPEFKQKTVLEIMYDSGFYSKSVFNTAFKKMTGMTPSEFRRRECRD
jgi:AraC-like DNA-binding protein